MVSNINTEGVEMPRAKKRYRQRRRAERPPKEPRRTTMERLIIERVSSEYSRYGRVDSNGKLL